MLGMLPCDTSHCTLVLTCVALFFFPAAGLLSAEDLARSLAVNPNISKARRFLAVPFIGKDVPSPSSEYSHPDIRLGLSMLAYRYEGMRRSDFKAVLQEVRANQPAMPAAAATCGCILKRACGAGRNT